MVSTDLRQVTDIEIAAQRIREMAKQLNLQADALEAAAASQRGDDCKSKTPGQLYFVSPSSGKRTKIKRIPI
jgi:hypothetical protein